MLLPRRAILSALCAALVCKRRPIHASDIAAVETQIASVMPVEAQLEWAQLGLSKGALRTCPSLKANQEGCVSTNPGSAPNRFMAPLRYDSDTAIAFKRVRSYLASRGTLYADTPEYLSAKLPSRSATDESNVLELHFIPDEPVVTFRILANKPRTMQPFCATRGCINGNQELRQEMQEIRDNLGWRSEDARFEQEKYTGWVPIFLH